MTITTVYKCDKCKTEQTDNNQFWTLEVRYKCGNSYMQSQLQMHVCRPCLESFGIIIKPKEPEKAPPPITLEDLIIDIVDNALANRGV